MHGSQRGVAYNSKVVITGEIPGFIDNIDVVSETFARR